MGWFLRAEKKFTGLLDYPSPTIFLPFYFFLFIKLLDKQNKYNVTK